MQVTRCDCCKNIVDNFFVLEFFGMDICESCRDILVKIEEKWKNFYKDYYAIEKDKEG